VCSTKLPLFTDAYVRSLHPGTAGAVSLSHLLQPLNTTLKSFLALSLTLHAGIGLLAATSAPKEPPAAPAPPDRWAGSGVEVDALPLPHPVSHSEPAAEPAARQAPAPEPERPAAARPRPAARAAERAEPAPERAPRPAENTPNTAENAPSAADARASRTRSSPANERAAATPAAPQASATASASAPETPGGAFGASGLPPGVRHLPNAFTRALAIANRGDRRWQALPIGRTGEARVRLAVGEAGELGELEFADERERDALSPVVRRLLDNTVLLLKAGRFSIDPKRLSAGVARLRVLVEISEREGANPEGDPSELFGVAWEAPRRDKPGKSGFILNSGRQVTAWVWIE
jgi:hypothetical protein